MDYMTGVVKDTSTSPMVSSVPNKKHTAASPLFQDSDTSEDKNNNNNAAPTKFIFSQVTKHSCVNDNVKEYTDRMRKRMVQQPHEPSHITVKDFQNKERVVISETSSATAAGKEKKREDKNSLGRREEISSSPVLSPSRIKTRFLGEGGEMHSSRGKIGPQVFHSIFLSSSSFCLLRSDALFLISSSFCILCSAASSNIASSNDTSSNAFAATSED